ncbi:MAG: hypothetical protein ACI8P3_001837 [Saprospiraceae bacterium]|jgi:hypothetical protein
MKKIFLFAFMLVANWSIAQIYVNQKNINAANYEYIEVWGKYNRATDKFFVMVDYGQNIASDDKNTHLKMHNRTGGQLQFNSIIAILNFVYLNGWELATLKRTNEIESFILKRRDRFTLPVLEEGASPAPDSN